MITITAFVVKDDIPWIYLHFANDSQRRLFCTRFPGLDLSTYGCCGLSLRGHSLHGLQVAIANSDYIVEARPESFYFEIFASAK